jgi:hypothetical protein
MNANDELPTVIKYMILYSISEKCLLKKILEGNYYFGFPRLIIKIFYYKSNEVPIFLILFIHVANRFLD